MKRAVPVAVNRQPTTAMGKRVSSTSNAITTKVPRKEELNYCPMLLFLPAIHPRLGTQSPAWNFMQSPDLVCTMCQLVAPEHQKAIAICATGEQELAVLDGDLYQVVYRGLRCKLEVVFDLGAQGRWSRLQHQCYWALLTISNCGELLWGLSLRFYGLQLIVEWKPHIYDMKKMLEAVWDDIHSAKLALMGWDVIPQGKVASMTTLRTGESAFTVRDMMARLCSTNLPLVTICDSADHLHVFLATSGTHVELTLGSRPLKLGFLSPGFSCEESALCVCFQTHFVIFRVSHCDAPSHISVVETSRVSFPRAMDAVQVISDAVISASRNAEDHVLVCHFKCTQPTTKSWCQFNQVPSDLLLLCPRITCNDFEEECTPKDISLESEDVSSIGCDQYWRVCYDQRSTDKPVVVKFHRNASASDYDWCCTLNGIRSVADMIHNACVLKADSN